ncbi:MAG: hypothetical protein MUD11_09450 [Rhodobacteraceae bacterium]|nr:hypothetical protein [Paracoccaceae bacterium]
MNDPQYARPGDLVAPLALDAAAPLYDLLHVPPGDGSLAMHGFLKQAVEYARLNPDPAALWAAVQSYAQATLTPEQQQSWLGWLFNAFTGLHPPDVDLSGWMIALDYFAVAPDPWKDSGMSGENVQAAVALLDRYAAALDAPGFAAALAEAQARPLTAWDKRLHQAYGFVYFDRAGGADPFTKLKFVHQGEALRRAVRETRLDDPDFPAETLRVLAQALIDRRDIWMPPGRTLGPLSTLA